MAALTLALVMPDVCGGLEKPGSNNRKARSISWFDEHMGRHYKVSRRPATSPPPLPIIDGRPDPEDPEFWAAFEAWKEVSLREMSAPPVEETTLSGADCYALRCALLHEGSDQ